MELLDLNDDVLLHILPFLDPTDRLSVSKTCTRMEDLCLGTKSLWESLTLNLGQKIKTNERKVKLTEDEKQVLKISGDRMQNIHISLDFSVADKFDQQSLDLLETESKKWNLKKFCFDALNVDNLTMQSWLMVQPVFETAMSYLDPNDARNANLETLSLSVNNWGADLSLPRILLAERICSLNCYESLENLALDCFFSYQKCYILYSFDERMLSNYSGMIGRFKNLRKLEINSVYLSNSLLDTLAQPDHVSLQCMTLVIDILFDEYITSWPQLVKSSPSLKVTVEAFYNTRDEDIRRTLPACVPIVSWKIYSLPQFGSYNRKKMEDMLNQVLSYERTLQSVAVQNGSERMCHSALLGMVTRCSKLQTLHLQGRIHSAAIVKMASLQRQWLKLGVLETDIIFPNSWEESRQQNIKTLCVEVSEKLGFKWRPELEATFRTIFSCPVYTS